MTNSGRSQLFSLAAKIGTSLVMTAVLLIVIEVVSGFFLLSREVVSGSQSSEDDTVAATLAWLWINPAPLREDPDFLWRNQPNARRTQLINPQAFGSTAEWSIRNNSLGYRGVEVRRDRFAKDAYRILCIGDSVTFGFNDDQDDSYPAQLAHFLNKLSPGRDIEIINAGVPGWTWLQGVRFLEREGLALEPDLVVIAHGVNDQLMRALVSDAERLEYADNPGVKWIARLRLLVGDTNTYRLIEQRFKPSQPPVAPSPGCQQQIDTHGYCKRVSVEQIESAVVRAGLLTIANGVDLLVLNLDFMKTLAIEAVRKATDAHGIQLIDLVHQLEFESAVEYESRSDALGLLAARDRASVPPRGLLERERRVIFRLKSAGHGASYSARGRTIFSTVEFDFETALNDEGRDGDERPGDGVFSGTLTMPIGTAEISFMYYQDDEAEFRPLPPLNSAFGDRHIRVNDLYTTPVFRFAHRMMMAEQTHPNAEGNAMIAKSVAFEIWKSPSFQR